MPDSKVCSRCKLPKPLTAFGVLKRSKDGCDSRCRKCNAERTRKPRGADTRSGELGASDERTGSVTFIDTRRSRKRQPRRGATAGPGDATPASAPRRSPRSAGKGSKSRPTKLTADVQTAICYAIATGCYYETAARMGGVDKTTFWRWMREGEKAETGELAGFYQAVLAAEADAEVRAVELWRAGMAENWQAARDFLARRHPQRWGPMERTGDVGGQREDFSEPTDDVDVVNAGIAFLEKLTRARSEGGGA